MAPRGYEPGDLVLQLQNDHAPGTMPHQREKLPGRSKSARLLPVGVAHIITQIVMNINHLRGWCGIGRVGHGSAVLPTLHSPAPGRRGIPAQWPPPKKGKATARV